MEENKSYWTLPTAAEVDEMRFQNNVVRDLTITDCAMATGAQVTNILETNVNGAETERQPYCGKILLRSTNVLGQVDVYTQKKLGLAPEIESIRDNDATAALMPRLVHPGNGGYAFVEIDGKKLLTLNGKIVKYPQGRIKDREVFSEITNYALNATADSPVKPVAAYTQANSLATEQVELEQHPCYSVHGQQYARTPLHHGVDSVILEWEPVEIAQLNDGSFLCTKGMTPAALNRAYSQDFEDYRQRVGGNFVFNENSHNFECRSKIEFDPALFTVQEELNLFEEDLMKSVTMTKENLQHTEVANEK